MNKNHTHPPMSPYETIYEEAWDLPPSFDLYSTPEVHTISFCTTSTSADHHNDDSTIKHNDYYSCTIDIEFIEPTTPLDISNTFLSSKEYDGSGHCVWTGAFLLIQCMDEILNRVRILPQNDLSSQNKKLNMIELGCGTGIGGLALMIALKTKTHLPMHVCFTDADPAVLNLCHRNCQQNKLSKDMYSIQELTWGQQYLMEECATTSIKNNTHDSFDIVLATDVLYDIDMLHPLFTTATQLLSSNPHGFFILSHIPRACYNDNNPPEAMENLEKYIVDQARDHYGLSLSHTIRPPGTSEKMSHQVLEFCSKESFDGSAIFLFQKKKTVDK
jgi:predicted nicotinamide N-methyase